MDRGFGNWATMHAERSPERTAYVNATTQEERTFGELENRTNAIANTLTAHGYQKGDRIALFAMNSIEFMEILIAIAKLGAIAVPVNFRLSPTEVEYILKDSGASALFYSHTLEDVATAATTDATQIRHSFMVPDSKLRAAGGSSDLAQIIADGDTTRVVHEVSDDDIAMIMYTSGTTGAPKGAMLSHGNTTWNAINTIMGGNSFTRYDTTILAAPLFHIGALGINSLPFLFVGGRSVILESFDPGSYIASMETYQATNLFLVPAMWAAVLQHPSFKEADWSAVSFAISGGAPAPIPIIKAMQDVGVPFTEGFGMTETAPVCSMLDRNAVLEKAGSIGKPVPFVDYRLMGPDGQEVPQGEIGELTVRGPNVFQGYWEKPEATEDALRDGWFFTGDLAKVDEDGFYIIVDRKKDMVITGGENVYSTEVEQVLFGHPDVVEVAVVGKPDERWGEAVTAVVVRTEGSTLTEAALIEWTRERIAHFKAPKFVEFVDALPRNATGKILKRDLRARWQETGQAVYR
jgi:fatty-acyl-CoA synthase